MLKLSEIYKLYPRKEGKTAGLKKLSKEVISQEDLLRFQQAVKNYSRLCELEGRERQYIKMFSSFASCWEDYESAEDLGLDKIIQKDVLQLKVVKGDDL